MGEPLAAGARHNPLPSPSPAPPRPVRWAHNAVRGGGSRPVAGGDGELSPVAEAAWYVIAAITYVAAGIWQKALLNWLVGPIWLIAVVVLGPVACRRVVRRGTP